MILFPVHKYRNAYRPSMRDMRREKRKGDGRKKEKKNTINVLEKKNRSVFDNADCSYCMFHNAPFVLLHSLSMFVSKRQTYLFIRILFIVIVAALDSWAQESFAFLVDQRLSLFNIFVFFFYLSIADTIHIPVHRTRTQYWLK